MFDKCHICGCTELKGLFQVFAAEGKLHFLEAECNQCGRKFELHDIFEDDEWEFVDPHDDKFKLIITYPFTVAKSIYD